MGAAPAAARIGEKSPSAPGLTHSPCGRKPAALGLPCARCRTYYAADLKSCPVCNGSERLAAAETQAPVPIAPGERLRDPALLEQERERFLRDFKAQLATLQASTRTNACSQCVKTENHPIAPVRAAVCEDCYDRLQERSDVLEAALHIELKEAAQIIYDAVWADPSNPDKTYENAANALLTELRKRSGVPQTFALLQPPTAD